MHGGCQKGAGEKKEESNYITETTKYTQAIQKGSYV